MKKIIIIVLVLLLTGCTSYTELNDLSIVNTMGIDYSDNYKVYISVKNSKNKEDIFSSINSNLDKAINDIYLSLLPLSFISFFNRFHFCFYNCFICFMNTIFIKHFFVFINLIIC